MVALLILSEKKDQGTIPLVNHKINGQSSMGCDLKPTWKTNQKINTAKLSMKVGFFASVLALGLIEGARFYAKTHWGN